MKRCPQCGREYDNTMSFCLDDGAELLYGPASAEPATAVLKFPSGEVFYDDPTRVFKIEEATNRHAMPTSNSIAVLPFTNISADPDNDYFCDGLAEELLNALAKIGELRVAARASAFSFKTRKTDINEIGSKLGVANVLDGSVRKSGDRLRISVQLLNASDGYHLWSETYDREMRDIFAVQDEITLAVIEALKLKLLGADKTSVLKRETENTAAYKAYLKGRYLRYTKNDHRGALAAYEEAVRLDPAHAPSLLGIAETCVLQAHYSLIDPLQACERARTALTVVREMHGDSAEALYIEGFIGFIERDWTACDRAYRRAIEIEPENSRALGTFGVINFVRGNVDDGSRFCEQARAVDPLAAYPYAMTGTGLVAAHLTEESLPFFEQAFEFEKDQTLALWGHTIAAIALRRFDAGLASAERAVEVSGRGGFFLGLLGWALAEAGRTEDARGILAELRRRPDDAPLVGFQAALLGELGDKDAAFEFLSRAADEFTPLIYYIGLPCFDSLRDDERFTAFAKRLGLANIRS